MDVRHIPLKAVHENNFNNLNFFFSISQMQLLIVGLFLICTTEAVQIAPAGYKIFLPTQSAYSPFLSRKAPYLGFSNGVSQRYINGSPKSVFG